MAIANNARHVPYAAQGPKDPKRSPELEFGTAPELKVFPGLLLAD